MPKDPQDSSVSQRLLPKSRSRNGNKRREATSSEVSSVSEYQEPEEDSNDGDNGDRASITDESLATGSAYVGTLIAFEQKQSPNYLEQHFRIAPYVPSPKPGTMVAVEAITDDGRHSRILERVTNAWEVNPHEDAFSSNLREVIPIRTEYAEEGSSTVIYRVAAIEPLKEAILDESGNVLEIRDVQTLPRAGALVHMATGDQIVKALGLEDNLDRGIYVGALRGSDISVFLKRDVIQRHMLIVGGIGTGKSYTRGVLAEELRMLGVPQVNIDVNGEMVEAAEELGGINLEPGIDFQVPLSALTADDVINAIPSLNGNMVDLVRHAHEELLKASRKSGDHFLLNDLLDKIKAVGPELEMKTVTINPAKSRTESLGRITYLGTPYDWKSVLTPGAFININCKGLLVSDLRIITAAVARDLQRLGQAKEFPFVAFSIDEFHLVTPANQDSVALQVIRELARIGRHVRIGLILTTQSPQDVDRSILKRLLTRFLHAIEPDQLEALRGVLSDASDDLVKQLPKMPQGTCILTGAYETIRHATVVQVRKRSTTHGGATPDIWSDFEAAGWVGKRQISQPEETHE
ncbi:ATP-binding protein [Coleofasciculus sp. FACHB-T130]|uniref:ATP-binding protein n=1 Tax=Cyanophyceae TaxID=3028117 RepID=UPI0016826045|nr:ATP-binding protein [Coleofasciculus sp. FACHB-T130]MBD1878355.1 ATP-binding protein [Coleofasciculus sp. FACHB-T130]